jgi:hypothetical protein
VQAKIRTIIENQSPSEPESSQESVYWSHNNLCTQVLGREHFGRVCGVGLGRLPVNPPLILSNKDQYLVRLIPGK